MANNFRATVLPVLGGLAFFTVLMALTQGIVALNASLSPTVPWFPLPALIILLMSVAVVNRRWPIRIGKPVGGRVYVVTLLLTYAVLCLGVQESWLHNLTTPAPAWPDTTVSRGFQLSFLLVLPFIAAVLAEVGFRGLMQAALEKVLPLWPMLGLLAVLNFLMHFYDPEQFSQLARLLALNIAWGYITWRTRSLRPALAGHVAMNVFVPLSQYGAEHFASGPMAFGGLSAGVLVAIAVTGLAALLAALLLSKKIPARGPKRP